MSLDKNTQAGVQLTLSNLHNAQRGTALSSIDHSHYFQSEYHHKLATEQGLYIVLTRAPRRAYRVDKLRIFSTELEPISASLIKCYSERARKNLALAVLSASDYCQIVKPAVVYA